MPRKKARAMFSTKTALTAMLPADAGTQVTVAVLPRAPPTACDPMVASLAVNVTVPEGAPTASEATAAWTVCETPTVPGRAVTVTVLAALAGLASPTSPATPIAITTIAEMVRWRTRAAVLRTGMGCS